jgi:predicted transcriptional regulator
VDRIHRLVSDGCGQSQLQLGGDCGPFQGVRVSSVMSRDCVTVNRAMNLQEFVDAFLLKTGQRCYAVEDHSHLVGPITPRDVGAIPREHRDKTTVRDAMRPLEPLHVITPDTPVLDALKLMVGNDVKQLPVVANGTMQGIVSRSQLRQRLQARSELHLPAGQYPAITAHG